MEKNDSKVFFEKKIASEFFLDMAESFADGEIRRNCRVVHATHSEDTYQLNPDFNYNYNNGLIEAILSSYSYHLPLEIRPDDVFLAIVAILGIYIENNHEKMKGIFVDEMDDTEKVSVCIPDNYLEQEEGWWVLKLKEVADETKKLIKNKEFCSWVKPSFSTTDKMDEVLSNLLFMNSMKKYLSFHFVIWCGIPKVTLKGELKDWYDLQKKVSYLNEGFGQDISNWAKLLDYVIGEFIASYKGEQKNSFWENAVVAGGRCGSGHSTCSGWINVFEPFDMNGVYSLSDYHTAVTENKFLKGSERALNGFRPSVMASVPVQISGDSSNAADAAMLYAGLNMIEVNKKTNTVKPGRSWGIVAFNREQESQRVAQGCKRKKSNKPDHKINKKTKMPINKAKPFAANGTETRTYWLRSHSRRQVGRMADY